MPKRDIKISGTQAIFLLIISIILGVGFIFSITYSSKLANNDFYTRLMSLIYIFPLGMAIFAGIPVKVSIKIEIYKLKYIVLIIIAIIILAIISSIFAYYFVYERPVLFDITIDKLTFSFFLILPFMLFSFGFLVLANTLLLTWGNYLIIRIRNFKLNGLFLTCLMIIMVYSRILFFTACLILQLTLLIWLGSFLQSKL